MTANLQSVRVINFEGKKGELLKPLVEPLLKYFKDPDIEDFQINDFCEVVLVKRGGIKEFQADNTINEAYIKALMYTICANNDLKFIKNKQEYVSCMLPINAFRFTGRVGSGIKSGIKISIRLNDNSLKYKHKDFNLSDKEYNFLKKYICDNKSSCFIVGGTGSGKTSFANLLIHEINQDEILNVVGDIHDFFFRLEQRYSELVAKDEQDYREQFDLLMRSNPDRILIPELTTTNVDLIMRSMNSGHKGFILTLHANHDGTAEAFQQNLALSGKENISITEIDNSIKKNIDFILYFIKDEKGKRYLANIDINNSEILKKGQIQGLFKLNNLESNKFIDEKPKIIPKETRGRKETKIHKNILRQAHKYRDKGASIASLSAIYNIPYHTFYRRLQQLEKEK